MDAALLALRDSPVSPAYAAKQLHPLPEMALVDRTGFLVDVCRGEVVLDIGASGALHEQLVAVAARVYGIDREDGPGVVGVDLDDYHAALPRHPDVTRIVCGEVLEHLSNPGWLLTRLRAAYTCPLFVTVPNAWGPQPLLQQGVENVNRDHVCWFSPHTLTVLLERAGYAVRSLAWYNGTPPTCEGLIAIAEAD